jgi:hypothetical protein
MVLGLCVLSAITAWFVVWVMWRVWEIRKRRRANDLTLMLETVFALTKTPREDATILDWFHVRMPVKRKILLMRAGIPATKAFDSKVRAFTEAELHVMAELNGQGTGR